MNYEKVSAADFGRSLRGLGLNMLVRDVTGLVSLLFQRFRQGLQRRQELFVERYRSTHMYAGWDDVVTALTHVYMIVRMHFGTTVLAGEMRDDFISVHV